MSNHEGPIPDWLTAKYMEDVLQKSFKDSNLTVKNIEISPGSQVGDNYVCQIYRIKADVIQNGKSDKLSIIGKLYRPTTMIESFGDDLDVFGSEVFFFDKLLPLMSKEITKYVPLCYHVDRDHSIFFMNDLIEDNYQLQPRRNTLPKEEAKLVFEALAVLHASTFEADKKDPTLKSNCRPSIWKKDINEIMQTMFRNSYKQATEALSFYGLPAKHEEALKRSIHRIEKEWCQICDFQENRLNFILHGDCWKSNMLFRYKDEKAESVKLLDFQIVNYNCFANDLMYFLFSSVDADVIVNDLDELLELYYKKLHSLAPGIPNLTLERVKEEFSERYYFGFLLLLCFRPVHFSEAPANVDEIIAGKENVLGFYTEKCKEDFRALLAFFEERGVLDTV